MLNCLAHKEHSTVEGQAYHSVKRFGGTKFGEPELGELAFGETECDAYPESGWSCSGRGGGKSGIGRRGLGGELDRSMTLLGALECPAFL